MEAEEKLISMACAGDENAMNEIFRENSYLVKSISRKYYLIGGEMDDIMQYGMWGLFKAIRTFKPDCNVSFKTYASRVIENEIISAVKIAYSHKGEILKDTDVADMSEYSAGNNPENTVLDSAEYKDLFESLLKGLGDFQKSAIEQYLEGYSYKEIADKLGKKTKDIDNALSRAKRTIKKNYLELKEKK